MTRHEKFLLILAGLGVVAALALCAVATLAGR